PRLDKRGSPAAKHRLLPKEIGLGLPPEGGLKDNSTRRSDPLRVRKRSLLGLSRVVLVDGNECGNALAFLVLPPDHEAGTLGCHHDHVDVCRWLDLAEMDIEPVGEHQDLVL